jgi:dTDP-4-amino-4,6-dideoxygalactose transaminase
MLIPSPARQRLYGTPSAYVSILRDLASKRVHQGSDVTLLEQDIGKQVSVPYTIAVNQGRVGIYLALRALITSQRRKVILSPFTIFDVINMVICAGGRPVFADIRRDSCTIDPHEIERLIDDETAVVLVTHMHVICAGIDRILDICRARHVAVVEDAAVAFGTHHGGRAVGTLGDVGVYSFGLFKNVNGIYGGAVVTHDGELYRRMAKEAEAFEPLPPDRLVKRMLYGVMVDAATNPFVFRALTFWAFRFGVLHDVDFILRRSRNDPDPFLRREFPASLRHKMSNAQARVVRAQLDSVEPDLRRRIGVAELYHRELRDLANVLLPPLATDGSGGFFTFPIQVEDRMALVRHLMRAGRDCAYYFYRNVADLGCFAEFATACPNASKAAASVVLLPTYPRYTLREAAKNVRAVREFWGMGGPLPEVGRVEGAPA